MRVVTALRERPRGRVEVELDGAPWRLVPAAAVVGAGLVVGRALDREAARTLGRELRRLEALGVAVRALRHRDLSRRRLEERLTRRGLRAGGAGGRPGCTRAGRPRRRRPRRLGPGRVARRAGVRRRGDPLRPRGRRARGRRTSRRRSRGSSPRRDRAQVFARPPGRRPRRRALARVSRLRRLDRRGRCRICGRGVAALGSVQLHLTFCLQTELFPKSLTL